MSYLVPQPMDRGQLHAALLDMAERVLSGDSFEGNIEYLIPDEHGVSGEYGLPTDAEFWVRGVYRIGNLQGQGGSRMIGTVPPP